MITLAKDVNAAVNIGAAVPHLCTGGSACFYAAGTFTTAVLHYSPTKDLPFVPVATLNAAGVATVNLGKGYIKLVLTGTVTGAHAVVS